ncbi:MAG: hypothetical protein ACPGUV_00735 [Polyangiales bacterium]
MAQGKTSKASPSTGRRNAAKGSRKAAVPKEKEAASASKRAAGAGQASKTASKPARKTGTTKTATGDKTAKAGRKATGTKAAGAKSAGSKAAPDKSGTLLAEILAADNPGQQVAKVAEALRDSRTSAAVQAARTLAELTEHKPELLAPVTDKIVAGFAASNRRAVQSCADALPAVAKLAPARVARHLDKLRAAFEQTQAVGQDGLVRTFAALCAASVAYQKRLEPVLTVALEGAEGKTLLRWTQTVLPALKGEPHARARAVVEGRLYSIPRPIAQKIADFLGMKLRPQMR